jgi:hypothetical protein
VDPELRLMAANATVCTQAGCNRAFTDNDALVAHLTSRLAGVGHGLDIQQANAQKSVAKTQKKERKKAATASAYVPGRVQVHAYVPGRVQVHTRSGYPKEPAIYGTIPPDGSGIIDDCAGRIYDSPRAFCIAHSQPANCILVYTDGALKGRRIVQLGSSQAGPITGDQGAVAATASAAPKQPAKAKATKKPAKAKPGGQPAAKRQLLQPLPDAGAQKEEMEVEVGCDYTLREV